MSKDRLKDLQKSASWSRTSYRRLSRQARSPDGQNTFVDSTIPLTVIDVDNSHHQYVAEFLAQIDLTRLLIDKIEELAEDVQRIHLKMLEPMADPKLEHELNDKTADIKKLAYDVSTKLKKLEQAQQDQSDDEKASAQWRIKESQIFNITRRFRDVMNKYNQESVTHRDRCKRAILRELQITGNSKTNAELEDILESGSPGTFTTMIDLEKARQAATEIQARHRDITQLEKSIKELHDMFIDLARLVSTQGDLIDNIEHNVFKATEFVDGAKENIKIAVDTNINTRKKKIIICIILIVIVIVLLILLASYLSIKKKITGR